MISPYTKYHVRTNRIEDDFIFGKRVFINFDIEYRHFIGYLFLNKYFI
jgi:hypothetical protein